MIPAEVTKKKMIEVELPVCPTCEHTGHIPKGFGRVKNLCTGGINDPHPRKQMVYEKFRRVVDE